MSGVILRRERMRDEGEGEGKVETETGLMYLQGKSHGGGRQSPQERRGTGWIPLQNSWKNPAPTTP